MSKKTNKKNPLIVVTSPKRRPTFEEHERVLRAYKLGKRLKRGDTIYAVQSYLSPDGVVERWKLYRMKYHSLIAITFDIAAIANMEGVEYRQDARDLELTRIRLSDVLMAVSIALHGKLGSKQPRVKGTFEYSDIRYGAGYTLQYEQL